MRRSASRTAARPASTALSSKADAEPKTARSRRAYVGIASGSSSKKAALRRARFSDQSRPLRRIISLPAGSSSAKTRRGIPSIAPPEICTNACADFAAPHVKSPLKKVNWKT